MGASPNMLGTESIDSLAQRIKTKHPEYQDRDNTDLVQRVIQKYPEYQTRLSSEALQRIAEPTITEPPGYFKRLGQSVGIPTTWEEAEAMQPGPERFFPPVMAAKLVVNSLRNLGQGVSTAYTAAKEAGMNIAEGGPMLPNIGKAASGALAGSLTATPFIGPPIQTAGEDIAQGRTLAGLGGLTGVVSQVATLHTPTRTAAIEALENPLKPMRTMAQDIAGAGRLPVQAAQRAYEARVTKLTEAHRAALEQAETDYQRAAKVSEETGAATDRDKLAAYEKNVSEVRAAHAEKVAQVEAEHARRVAGIRSRFAEEAAEKRRDWVDQVIKVKDAQSAAARAEAQRAVLETAQDEYANLVMENVAQTKSRLHEALSARWENFKDVVGRETPLNPSPVYNAVAEAKSKFLRGSPQSLKVFNDLLAEIGLGEEPRIIGKTLEPGPGKDAKSLLAVGTEPALDLETARTHSSAIGDKRFSGELPGNVYHALGRVQDALESEIAKAAEVKGQGKEYAALRGDWAQYMKDWNDMNAVATGGSPLARVQRAVDPGFVLSQVHGKAGNRLIEMLARYKLYGAAPELLQKLRRVGIDMGSLPKVRVPEMPEQPKIGEPHLPERRIVPPPTLPEPPALTLREVPKRAVVKPLTIPAPIDPVALRRSLLEKMAGQKWSWFDVFPPRTIERLLLYSENFREWVAKQPRKGD